MDLVSFRSIRSARRAQPKGEEVLPPLEFGGVDRGPLVQELFDLVVGSEVPQGQVAEQARARAEAFLLRGEGDRPIDPDDLRRPSGGGGDPGAAELWLFGELDRWLTAEGNRPDLAKLEEQLRKLLEAINVPSNRPDWFTFRFATAWFRLIDTLAAAVLIPTRGELARRLTRLLVVGGVVERRAQPETTRPASSGGTSGGSSGGPRPATYPGTPFQSSDQVQALLRERVPLLPSPPFPEVLPSSQVRLVRQATVSDLFVVRSEWRCYQAGEIADIRNVMAGEKLEHKTLRIDEREVIEATETERIVFDEQSEQTTERSDISEETSREVQLAIQAEGQVDVSAQYGPAKVNASVGASVDFSQQDATRRATRLAREAISRAVSRIETRTRAERIERSLTRSEDATTHSLEAPDGKHERGIYRWVDRIDRLQVFRYPDRLQLEFQLPEPGRFLREQLRRPLAEATVADPGAFTIDAKNINRNNYTELAAAYQAEGIPAPPDESIAVSQAVALDPSEESLNGSGPVWNAPAASKTVEIAVPPGYAAKEATVSLHATPVRAVWRREHEQSESSGDLEGFHTISATVAVGDNRWTSTHSGPANALNTVQSDTQPDHATQYLDADLEWAVANAPLDPPLVTKAPVTLAAVGANSAVASVEIACGPTEQAMAQWRQDVFDALLAAHEERVREYRAEQARLGLGGAVIHERSPARNAEMIRHELRRHAIAWLLDESPFRGREAVVPDSPPDIDLAEALEVADEIQFLEQAFEWSNLTYVAYPYYWARRGEEDSEIWEDLLSIETVDPELAQFLRSGSARVILPARPEFTGAAQHWLLFRQPWLGGPAPVPGDPLHISVATEIRDLTRPPADGEPGESWEVRMPTTLRWLDPASDNLPHNLLARLGAASNAPADPLCRD